MFILQMPWISIVTFCDLTDDICCTLYLCRKCDPNQLIEPSWGKNYETIEMCCGINICNSQTQQYNQYIKMEHKLAQKINVSDVVLIPIDKFDETQINMSWLLVIHGVTNCKPNIHHTKLKHIMAKLQLSIPPQKYRGNSNDQKFKIRQLTKLGHNLA